MNKGEVSIFLTLFFATQYFLYEHFNSRIENLKSLPNLEGRYLEEVIKNQKLSEYENILDEISPKSYNRVID